MRNYFYVAVISIAALLLVVGLRTIYAFQGPDQSPPDGNGQLAADGDNIGVGTTSPKANLHVEGSSYFLGGNGDVNSDGVLSPIDSLLIINWLEGTTQLTPEQYAAADINGDGSVNAMDFELLIELLNGDITIDQAHHNIGKQARDRIFHTTLDGMVGIGYSYDSYPPSRPAANLHVLGGSYFSGGNGDVSGDGVVSPIDLLRIAGWLNGKGLYGDSDKDNDGWIEGDDGVLTSGEYARADFNGDGSVNSIDFNLLANTLGDNPELTLAQAKKVGKRVQDNIFVANLDGDVGIGTARSSPSERLVVGDKNTVVKMLLQRIDSTINNGNALGRIQFGGTGPRAIDDPPYKTGSYIQGSAQGTWSSSESPGDLSFYTTPTGSTASAKRMKIHNDGLVEIIGQLKIKGGVEIIGQLKIKGGSPVKGKFLKAETNSGKATWDYWPGDHLWGQGRPGIVVKNTSGECTVGDFKISRSIPSVEWEGAAASCPKGWWVCTAAERGTATCGTGTYTVNGCFPNYTAFSTDSETGNIAAPAVYLYKAGASHVSELTPSYIYTFNPSGTFYNGTYSANVIDAWVADAYNDPDKGITGRPVSINGETKEGAICDNYPVWCCANK